MAVTKKNTVGIAKGTARKKPVAKKPARRKPAAKKPVEKKLTPAEERDLKAKQKVEELLKDSTLTLEDKKDELLELDEGGDTKGAEWLEEQVPLLTQQLEDLRGELALEKDRNNVLTQKLANSGGGDGETEKTVTMLFTELQTNYTKMGKNQQTGAPNLFIAPTAFLNRMVMLFPFLASKKQF